MKSIQVLRSARRLAAILAAVSLSTLAFAQSEKVIFDFSPYEFPNLATNLISDASGNFYGADGNGSVFELSPPAQAGGSWTPTEIYSVPDTPLNLAIDKNGNIFGTTLYGGIVNTQTCPYGCGLVFELSPPAELGGAWTETVVYEFPLGLRGPTVPRPVGLTVGPDGILYGATQNGGNYPGNGTIFQLSPPAQAGGAWTHEVLYEFQGGSDGIGPTGSFLIDKNHNLYGTTKEGGFVSTNCSPVTCGTVFELSPPAVAGGSWTKATLFEFQGFPTDGYFPTAGLIADKAGNLYGSTYFGGAENTCDCGTVFQLAPPSQSGGAWTETVLHTFANSPDGVNPLSLTSDPAGNLYGATYYGGSAFGGIVFELSPPAQSGGAWTETILNTFVGSNGLNAESKLVYKSGALYGATQFGGPRVQGCGNGCGVIYEVRP
jgi:uncharacterized repeat protein (TIGR03803 family)